MLARGIGALVVAFALLAAPSPAARQGRLSPASQGRKATTVSALATYPVFFHTQAVRVRGTLEERDRAWALEQGDAEVKVAGPGFTRGAVPAGTFVEIMGVFVDVGRLEVGDPRLANVDLAQLWQQAGRSWPGVGELPLLLVDTLREAEPFPAPSVRAIALEPWRYADQRVTVTGRFRGLNLYADLPDAPSREKHAFVLQSADSALWVVGMRPRGSGFNLDPEARVDTGRWLEVSGTVSFTRGLPVLEATLLALGKPPAEQPPSEPVTRVPTLGPRPEVVFSLPTHDEIDVAPASAVRIQFSRDIDPKSLAGQVRVRYVPAPDAPSEPLVTPAFTTTYTVGNRVLEIRFTTPPDAYRTMQIELLEGIQAKDGAALVPWTLTFTFGS